MEYVDRILTPTVRGWLYIIIAVGTPIVAVLTGAGVLPELYLQLWSGIVSAIAVLARFNTPKN